jgi:hypothetical protein
MFEATCPGCGVEASPYDALCPPCGASLRVPCRACTALVHVADAACYRCDATSPADPTPRAALPSTTPSFDALSSEPAELGPIGTGRPAARRLAPLAMLIAAGIVVVSGAVLVATSRGPAVPTGGVSSAAASPAAPTTAAGVPSDPAEESSAAAAERDLLTAELQFALAVPAPVAECLADSARTTLGDDAFVAAHRALIGGSPEAGHAALDPVIAAAGPACGAPVPAAPGG